MSQLYEFLVGMQLMKHAFAEQHIDNSKEFCNNCYNCIVVGFPFFSLPSVILFEIGTHFPPSLSDYPEHPSYIGVFFFEDCTSSFKFSRLLSHWSKPTETNEVARLFESFYIFYLRDEIDSRFFSYSWYRDKSFYSSSEKKLGNGIYYIPYFLSLFPEECRLCYGIACKLINSLCRGFPFSIFSALRKNPEKLLFWSILYVVRKRELIEGGKDIFFEDRWGGGYLWEGDGKETTDLGFSFSDFMGYLLRFPYKDSESFSINVRGWRKGSSSHLEFEKKASKFCINGVILRRFVLEEVGGFSQFVGFEEGGLESMVIEEGKELELVESAVFKSDDNGAKMGETLRVHEERFLKSEGVLIKDSNKERIFGDVDTAEKSFYFKTFILSDLDREMLCRLILLDKIVLENSINSYKTKRAEYKLPYGPESSGNMGILPSPGLSFIKFQEKNKYYNFC